MVQPHSGIWTASGPTGAGKTTLNRALLDVNSHATPLLRVTTRERRPTDLEGEFEYVTPPAFDEMARKGRFLSVMPIRDYLHGLPYKTVNMAMWGGLWITDLDPQMVQKMTFYVEGLRGPGIVRSVYLDLRDESVMRDRLLSRDESDIEGRIEACRSYHTRIEGLHVPFCVIDARLSSQEVFIQAYEHFISP